jgi:hypothetical protein
MTDVQVTGLNGGEPAAAEPPTDPRLERLRSLSVANQIKTFRALRDRVKEKKKAFEASIADEVHVMGQLAGLLQVALDAVSTKKSSIKTEYGTCYFSTKWTTSVSDKDAFMNYVVEHQAWSLLDKRANVTAVKAFAAKAVKDKAEQVLPPGVKLTGLRSVRVRKAGETANEDDDE